MNIDLEKRMVKESNEVKENRFLISQCWWDTGAVLKDWPIWKVIENKWTKLKI